MNPSHEYMRRIRREEQAKLFGLRRERVTKALDGLTLHGDASAMLAQIAYAVHPHVGAWDAESCDHLRNVITELIGDDHEAASGAQHACSCGAGGCHRGHEQTALDSERQEAVSRLRGTFLDTGGALKKLATALGVRWNADNTNKSVALMQRRLIHLLGGDQSHDSSSTRQESETGITDELHEWITLHKTKITSISLDDCSIDEGLTEEGKQLVAIADKIDAQFERSSERHEVVLQDANNIQLLAECLKPAIANNDKRVIELEAERDDLLDLLRDARDEYKMLDRMSVETSVNFHTMRDRVWGLEAERDELKEDLFKYDRSLTRSEMECRMYLDLLRDAAKDYKALQDKLNHVVEVCRNYAEAKDA